MSEGNGARNGARNGRWVGTSVPRKEDRPLVGGHGSFADDATAPGVLHCAILRSPHAHARIISVDCSAARTRPGVVAALSGTEALQYWGQLPGTLQLPGLNLPTSYGLAVDKVVFQGEPVAVVVAESRYLAEDALDAIQVAYEPLPVVMDVDAALGTHRSPSEAQPLIYEEWGTNVQLKFEFEYGDVEKVLASAHVVVRDRIGTHRYGAMPLEPRAVLAEFNPETRQLVARLSTQVPHQARALIAEVFGLPESNIRIISGNVGGGFGAKLGVSGEVIPILMSIVTGRPVKWAETRGEWMLGAAAGSRGYVHDMELGFDSEGRLLAVRDRFTADVGCDSAVRGIGLGAVVVGALYVPGPYRVPAFAVEANAVVTNKTPYDAYRGYGKDLSNMPMERMMDRGAEALGLDRVEIRRRNLLDEFPYEMASGPIIENGSFHECLTLLTDVMDLPALQARQEAARQDGRYLGIGLVSRLEPSAGAIPMSIVSGVETATVRLHPDGTVMALTGIQPIGQSVETTYAQVVADELGVSPDEVRMVYGDTDSVPFGMGSYASRGATFGVTAVYEAAKEVRRKLLKVAANLLEADVSDVVLEDGHFGIRGDAGSRRPIRDATQAAYFYPGPYYLLPDEAVPTLEATHVYTNPAVRATPDEHGRIAIYPTHGSGAEGALVEVDPETGQVVVERIWLVSDAGNLINPGVVDSQVIGSTVQAYGGAMTEQLEYDDAGNMLVRTLGDYQIPTFGSAPVIESHHIETPSPITPLGTKGVGEGGQIGTAPVLMAAIEDALRPFGVKVNSTPLTPERVLALIEAAEVPVPA
jgi:carbon-monoxide dehydrogenase large subunit